MATTAAPRGKQLTIVLQTLYTCPANMQVGVDMVLSNIDGVNDATADVSWTDADNVDEANPLVFHAKVNKQDACITPRVTLDPGDTIVALASANGRVQAKVNVVFSTPISDAGGGVAGALDFTLAGNSQYIGAIL